MESELNQLVMLERVELIARLTSEGDCQEKDRVIALDLIAELAQGNIMKNNKFGIVFSGSSLKE